MLKRCTCTCFKRAYTTLPPIVKPTWPVKDVLQRGEEMRKNVQDRKLTLRFDVTQLAECYRAYVQANEDHQSSVEERRKHEHARGEQSTVEWKQVAIANGKKATKAAAKLKEHTAVLDTMMKELPNWTHPNVPIGPESNAKVIYGKDIEKKAFKSVDHVTYCEARKLYASAAHSSGSQFVYLRGPLAELELALMLFAQHHCQKEGFLPMSTPEIVYSELSDACGFAPRDKEASQQYAIEQWDENKRKACLTGTAEIPLAAYHLNSVISDLPKLYVGHGHAFRTEAGARGKENKGLYRLHQFSKVELFALTAPAEAEDVFQKMLDTSRSILDALELDYR